MKKYNLGLCFLAFLLLFSISGVVNAQYWYQYGVRAGVTSNQNSGAAVSIQTITPQLSNSGSLGYWVGETLDNGAFLQVGYVIENQSGMYPALCDKTGCYNYQHLNAGDAQWFYEYFPSGYEGGFLGELGSDGSAGKNGTFHRYAFYASNGNWYFTFDGNILGNVSLGTTSSGVGIPVAFGEVANTTGISSDVSKIVFSNFSVYKSGGFRQVQEGLSYIGYGVGSKTNLLNPYGVQEIGNRINYFEVGSNLPQPQNNTILWNLGYVLKTVSQYGNLSNNTNYVAYSNVKISAPSFVQLNSTTRMMFTGWQGSGLGAYSGPLNATQISMNSNITETASWQKQYYLNASSQYGGTYGSGWYNNGSTVSYGIQSNLTQTSATSREKFAGWSNGNIQSNGSTKVNAPVLIAANWHAQYFVNVQSLYDNVSGGGWYDNGSIAQISVSTKAMQVSNNTQLGFYQWSNGKTNQNIQIPVTGPIILSAQYRYLYQTKLETKSAQGANLSQVALYSDDLVVANDAYLFGGVDYNISSAYYKGVKMAIKQNFSVDSPQTVQVVLPVYSASISSRDIFGLPINSSLTVSFSNTSTQSMYTGANGTVLFQNVPYGYVTGTVTYLGISQNIGLRNGSTAQVTFVSLLDIEIFALVIVIIGISYFVAKRHFRQGGYREEIEQGA